jgi:porin
MTWFFDAGLVAYGPIASRPKDFLSLGVAYGSFSTDLRESQEIQQLLDPSIDPQLFEMTIEASYGIHMAPGFTLQPGVQVIVNPGGSPDTPTAIAAGVNAVISF